MSKGKISELTYAKAKLIVTNHEQSERDNEDYDREQKLKKLIGNYYKCRNSYGSGEDWWMYVEILGVNGTSLTTRKYEITSHHKAEVEEFEHPMYYGSGLDNDYQKISRKEFVKGRDAVLHKLGLKVEC